MTFVVERSLEELRAAVIGASRFAHPPHVQTPDGETWTKRVQVVDCHQLELDLPTRKKSVETAKLRQLRDAARLAIYLAMVSAGPPPQFAYKDHARAAKAGIDRPVLPAQFRR